MLRYQNGHFETFYEIIILVRQAALTYWNQWIPDDRIVYL